jgi:ABC-type proline/glycine betaine transport system ATPase subunit
VIHHAQGRAAGGAATGFAEIKRYPRVAGNRSRLVGFSDFANAHLHQLSGGRSCYSIPALFTLRTVWSNVVFGLEGATCIVSIPAGEQIVTIYEELD